MAEWRDISGWPSYQISDDGRLKSFKREGTGVLIKLHASSNGYFTAHLYDGRRKKCVSLHRLVAMAFIPNPGNLPQVNHKNGDKHDNRVENLEWVTCSQNHRHAYRNLGKKSPAIDGKWDRRGKLSPLEVRIIRDTKCTDREMAEYLGLQIETVNSIRNRHSYAYLD